MEVMKPHMEDTRHFQVFCEWMTEIKVVTNKSLFAPISSIMKNAKSNIGTATAVQDYFKSFNKWKI